MATRLNVTAIRDCPPSEVRAVMSEVLTPVCRTDDSDCRPIGDLLQLTEHGGWVSFTTSVWGVSAADLNRGLCKLARPAVQFTTSDGSRWYLTVHGGPAGQVHFNHEFGTFGDDPDPAQDAEMQAELEQPEEPPEIDPSLAFLEDDPPPGPARTRSIFDLIVDRLSDVGPPVPDEFREAVAALPYSQAAARFRRWHADYVVSALAAAGIPFDETEARRAMLWENVTENERGSDLGNLPRLLVALGLGGDWDEYIRQANAPLPTEEELETTEADADDVPDETRADLIAPVLQLTAAAPLTTIAGGPVAWPVDRLSLVSFFPEALNVEADVGTVLSVTLPAGAMPDNVDVPNEYSEGQVELLADGFRVGLQGTGGLDKRSLKSYLGKPLSKLLLRPPDGTVLEVAFAAEGHPALLQRYRGTVDGDNWHIGETHPPLTAATLTEALKLARRREKESHPVRDEAEADALADAVARDPNLSGGKFKRDGLSASYEFDFSGALLMAIFRHRHAAAWDLTSYEREAAEKLAEQIRQARELRRNSAEAARKRAAPHDAEVLYRGKYGPYWKSDFLLLTALEQETRERWDRSMETLGLSHVGDLVAKKQRDIVLRVHGAADGSCYGVLMGKRTIYIGYEFVTRFADGSTLTTTTNSSVDSHPEAGIYYKHGSGLTAEALYEKHHWGIERFRTHKGTTPVALPLTLLGVAQELDAAFARQSTIAPQELVSVDSSPMSMGSDDEEEDADE